MIPLFYEIYTKLTQDGKSNLEDEYEIITTKSKDGSKAEMTPEEMGQRAGEEEAERLFKFAKKMQETEQEMGIYEEDEDYMGMSDQEDEDYIEDWLNGTLEEDEPAAESPEDGEL